MKKYRVTVNGTVYEVELEELTGSAPVSAPAAPAAAPAPAASAAPAAGEQICAPMPGNILAVNVTAGQAVKKGDVLGVARIAGIMAAKRTSELIPLCHPLPLTKVCVDFELLPEQQAVEARCTVKTSGVTGVEMEALTGVSTALLTIYDMLKAVDRGMCMTDIRLLEKHGGKSGDWVLKK